MKMRNYLLMLFALVLVASSCSTPKVAYLQDVRPGTPEEVLHKAVIRIQPGDKLSIVVSSKDPLLEDLFNLPGTTTGASSQNANSIGYMVDSEGHIDFPVVGKIFVSGQTREEVAATVKGKLLEKNLIKDPVVVVNFLNLTVSVLGEVASPGRISIDKDQLSLLDALAQAGDLTVYGLRDRVFVQREEDGKQVIHQVDLTSGYSLYASPVYYLQQNDIVYVQPNRVKARSGDLNANTLRTPTFWMTIASFIASMVVLITN